ncbi:MAG: sugar transferase [Anaerolineales bacterium]|nr:sugar transferase [Anaerolineales bacterium]
MNDTVTQGSYQTLKLDYAANDASYYYVKRALDVFIVVMALPFLLPIMAAIGIMIKLDTSGPVFFRQERIGSRRCIKDGKVYWEIKKFRIFKFRSMVQNADESFHKAYIEAFVRGNVEKSDNPHAAFKISHDPRVTPVGRILRKTSLDELPQLFNVLLGDMSLVGPRPVPEYEVAEYREVWHFDRLASLPGVTGYWQVKGRGQVEFDEMIRLDLEYIRRQSLWMDLKIMFLTVPAVLSGSGAE